MFPCDVSLPICHDDGGERQGDNQSDESEQGAPDREGEEQDGRIQAHCLSHDFGCDDEVDDDLHDAENQYGGAEHCPEVLSCVGGFQHGEEGCRDECQCVEVWHEVHDADEDSQSDSHGETDDGKADAEKDTHGECHESLSADVVVEFALHVSHEFIPEGAVFLRENLDPVLGEVFVVEQDEEHI